MSRHWWSDSEKATWADLRCDWCVKTCQSSRRLCLFHNRFSDFLQCTRCRISWAFIQDVAESVPLSIHCSSQHAFVHRHSKRRSGGWNKIQNRYCIPSEVRILIEEGSTRYSVLHQHPCQLFSPLSRNPFPCIQGHRWCLNEHSILVAFDMMAFFNNQGKEGIQYLFCRTNQQAILPFTAHFTLSAQNNPSPPFRHFLYPTNVEVRILVDKFKHLLPKHLSSIMKPINMTDTFTPLFPSKSVEKCLIPWHNGILAWCWQALMFKKGKKFTQSNLVEGMALKNSCRHWWEAFVLTWGFEGAAELIFMLQPEGPRTDQLFPNVGWNARGHYPSHCTNRDGKGLCWSIVRVVSETRR